MTRKDDYYDPYNKIIEKVNDRHMNIERKKFERTINNFNLKIFILILVILFVIAIVFIFSMLGFQPNAEHVFFEQLNSLFAEQSIILDLNYVI
jgi:flagellar basal body-associated protein FliL